MVNVSIYEAKGGIHETFLSIYIEIDSSYNYYDLKLKLPKFEPFMYLHDFEASYAEYEHFARLDVILKSETLISILKINVNLAIDIILKQLEPYRLDV